LQVLGRHECFTEIVSLEDSGFVSRGSEKDVVSKELRGRLHENLPRSEAEAITFGELHRRVGSADTTLKTNLKNGLEHGTIRKTGRGVKGNPFKYWCPVQLTQQLPVDQNTVKKPKY